MKDESGPGRSGPDRLLVMAGPESVVGRGVLTARSREPSADDIRALEKQLAAALGVAALGTVAGAMTAKNAAATSASAWLSAGAVKVMGAVVVATLGASGGTIAWKHHAAAQRQAAARGSVVQTPSSGARPPRAREAEAPQPPDQPTILATTPVGGTPEERTPVTEPIAAPAPQAESPGQASATAPAQSAARVGSRSVGGSARTAALAPIAPPPSVKEDPALANELSLIDRAQHALRDDPRRALQLVQEHAGRFPNQLLEQEREVVAVAALVKLGRKSEAAARAQRFIDRFPRSAHLIRMRATVASSAP